MKNGFDLEGTLIPSERILHGGPPQDGIASIDRPRFLPAAKADALDAKDRVLGLRLHGQARAYPIAILNWHEIDGLFKAYPFAELAKSSGVVHDQLGEQAIVVRFDPEHQNATLTNAQGQSLPGVVGFWFAWYAFHPDTFIYKAKPR